MSFLNKFKKEFDGLNIGEKLQNYQSGQAGQRPSYGYNANSYPQPGYGQQPPPSNPGQSLYQNPQSQQQHGGLPQYGAQSPPQYGYQGQPGTPGQQQYMNPGGQSYTSSPPPLQHPTSPPTSTVRYQHNPSQTGFTPTPPHPGSSAFSPPPPQNALSPYGGPASQPAGSCPAPPRWIPFWSEQHQQWFFAETSGRSEWTAPIALAPMPAFNGSSITRGDGGALVSTMSPPPQGYGSGTVQQRPGMPEGGQKSSSSYTLLAAAGGFVAGGIATALVYEAVDAHKKKKRHGTDPPDFSDFGAYPPRQQDLTCNQCDQTVYGPYAHCAKCDGGDFDVCRTCLAQGATCNGKGKHRLIKVYPECECNECKATIQGDYYCCMKCDDGDWDVCQKCLDRGVTCNADGGHRLAKLYIPRTKGAGGDSSSDEE